MGLFPRRPTPENPKKQKASSNHHHSASSEGKKQVINTAVKELHFVICTKCVKWFSRRCFCSESQHSDRHSGLSTLPTSLTAVSRRVQPVFGHVELWRTSVSCVCGQLWSTEAAKGERSRSRREPQQGAAPPHAALHVQQPCQVERGGRLWVYLLAPR